MSAGTAAVLRRKAGNGRSDAAEARGPVTPDRALADAFRRAAEEELGLGLVVKAVRERRATPDELVELLPEDALLGLLAGPEEGAGLFCLDTGALSAVLEMRTMGRVTARPPQPRRPTRTDAALTRDVIDRILAEFEAPLLPTEAARWASGWRYHLHLEDRRPLPVMLDDTTHRVLETELAFPPGEKTGRALIAVPAAGRAMPRAPEPAPQGARATEAEAWTRAFGAAIEGSAASLDAVLGRIRLPLSDLSRLAPGDRIALPLAALGAVRLTAPGGTDVASARLGQAGGARAVRLLPPGDGPAPVPEGVYLPAGSLARETRADTAPGPSGQPEGLPA